MTIEIELKYELSANSKENSAIADDISAMLKAKNVSFEIDQHQLTNDYFDTKNLTLRKLDFGLRVRTKDHQYEQTIKTAGKIVGCLHQRPEYNVEIATSQLDLSLFPKEIWPENINLEVLEKDLQIIFSTNFFRQTWLIYQGISVVELALDSGDIFTKSGNPIQGINELEIELVTGDEQALFVLAEQLSNVVTMAPGTLSKAARGYALYHDQKM